MGDARKCASCGGEIPSDAPAGACPRCALAAALASDRGDPTPESVAAKLPGFDILGVLGRGGMGVVFKARQRALDRVVALKVLPPAMAAAPGFSDRFAREAKAMARLAHPNIVAVHEFGDAGGLFYLVLEYVDGLNVREAMRAGRIGPKEALAIVPQICDALQYAHDRGVVHRDVKPENVMIDRDGRVRIADFGLAKLADRETGDASLTGASQVMGTLHYMAPEQWEHPKDVDHRADIYSLGVVFYEMLTGELPVGKFEPPSHRAAIDVRIDAVVLRSLERDRELRWQRADDVKTGVSAITSSAATAPAPAPLPSETAPAKKERFESSYTSAAITALAAAGFGVAAVAAGIPGLWWISGICALGAAIEVVQAFAKRQKDAPAAAAAPETWLSPVMTGVAASAGVVLIACIFWGADMKATRIENGAGSLALVLGFVLAVLLGTRRQQARVAEATNGRPPGPPVLIGVASAAALVLGLFCLVHAQPARERVEEPEFGPPADSGEEPPSDAVVARRGDRAPWEFDVEVPKESTTKADEKDRQGIWERWRLVQALEGGASDDRMSSLYAAGDWGRISILPAADRPGRAKEGGLGLPLVDRKAVGAPLSEFWISKVRFGGPPGEGALFTSAYVTVTDGHRTVRFTMVHGESFSDLGSKWRFTAAPVEID